MYLTSEDIVKKQQKSKFIIDESGQKAIVSMTFEQAVEECQRYINQKASYEHRMETDSAKRRQYIEKLIEDYVVTQNPLVEGYTNPSQLRIDLIKEITEFGPITDLMYDQTIDEIRINGKNEILVERFGDTEVTDKKFSDDEQYYKIISKLLRASEERLVPGRPFVNARTLEGYRVNATHAEISRYKEFAVVIRKFKKVKFTAEQLIQAKSFSKNMYKMMQAAAQSDLNTVVVGPTGSGKTTLMEIIVKSIPPMQRKIVIENPSELDLRQFTQEGLPACDVVQYECVTDTGKNDPTEPTLANLIINAMRQSPHWIIPGELRAPEEFKQSLIAMQTGHYIMSTYHAEGGEDAIDRFLLSYLSVSNEPAELALRMICSKIKLIIYQKKLPDGKRRVMSISEVLGAEGLRPIIKPIYIFEVEDAIRDPETGKVKEIKGKHKRVGKISDKLADHMVEAGLSRKQIEFLTKDVDPNEEEDYNIEPGEKVVL